MREVVGEIARRIGTGGRRVVHVCGHGGTGKTTTSDRLARELGGIVFRADWYLRYPTLERRQRIADALESGDPGAIEAEENPQNWHDWVAFAADLETLRTEGTLRVRNVWNQDNGLKDVTLEVAVDKDSLIICDGIYLLHDGIRELADASIHLHVSKETARARADLRDQHRSDPAYLAYKRELLMKYDVPYFDRWASYADLHVDNSGFELQLLANATV